MSTEMAVYKVGDKNGLVAKFADRFGVDQGKLVTTLKATAFKGAAQISDEQMLALLVVARHIQVTPSGCWEWLGSKTQGYGQLTYKQKHYTAHRFSYMTFRGPIAPGMWVLHHCDNRPCVNPEHLYQGTPANNRADMLVRERWKHPWSVREACGKGHRYNEAGFWVAADGSRVCKVCDRDHRRRYRAAAKGDRA